MITALELRNSEFSRSARGYKAAEVDEVLEEAAVTVEQLQKENSELLRKMDILAQKIHEYRQDEDSIKNALVMAQRTADSVIRDAKEKAETENSEINQRAKETLESAITKADKITREAEEKAMSIAHETKNKSISIIAEAKDKAGKMIFEVLDMRRKEQANYEKLKKQATNFRVELLNLYKAQVELINRLPESIHDEVDEPVSEIPHVDISEMTKDADEIIPDTENVPDNIVDVQDNIMNETEPTEDFYEPIVSEEVKTEPEAEVFKQQDVLMPQEEMKNEVYEKETAGSGKISGGFIVSEEEPLQSKFGNIKFGEYYDPNDEDDDAEEENSGKHSFFRKKR